jgi:hypothetical protein
MRKKMTFTTNQLEALKPIVKDAKPLVPNLIDGVCVNLNPQSEEIQNIIDLRRIGPSRRTYCLAKSIDGKYYWFHAPYADRDRQLSRDYHHKFHMEGDSGKAPGVKKLRNGKTVRT